MLACPSVCLSTKLHTRLLLYWLSVRAKNINYLVLEGSLVSFHEMTQKGVGQNRAGWVGLWVGRHGLEDEQGE